MRRFFLTLLALALPLLTAMAAGPVTSERSLYSAGGSRVKTLDPAQADDFASRNMTGCIFDTLLEYDYLARPYQLRPSMLAAMPEANATFDRYVFTLRPDLVFADNPCFKSGVERKITADDVLYSIKRVAYAPNHSPVLWMYRSKIKGLDEFTAANDFNAPIAGFQKIDDYRFAIELVKPDPRFLYILALPNSAVVSKRAFDYYGDNAARKPVGSGPFVLKEWINDYKLELVRNPDYRTEYFKTAENPDDRNRKLPLADSITFYLIKQPMSSWLMFLQGKLDLNALDKDNLDLIAGGGSELNPVLKKRGIKLLRVPEFEIRYVGFNFADPKFKDNLKLRQAISLAYDVNRRVEHSNYQLIPAQGPIPPGVAGYDVDFRNPYAVKNLELAKKLLAEAGYPGGIDPATGEALTLTFDQTGNTSAYRQMGELTVADLAKIGIKVTPVLNNNARFYEKLRQGKLQLFRLSWIGDYPDAENFLQLFYSKNIGSCNRTGFSDPEFDRMFEEILPLPDSPGRTRKYQAMVSYLAQRSPWVFEGFPIAYQLNQPWLENYLPHDFAFSRWKYLSVDPARREAIRQTFTPLTFQDLNERMSNMEFLVCASKTDKSGIYRFKIEPDDSVVQVDYTHVPDINYICLSRDGKMLYASCDKKVGSIRPGHDGKLTLERLITPAGIAAACHVTVSPDGKKLYCANYSSANFLEIDLADNELSDMVKTVTHEGKGVNLKRQEKPHPHFTAITPDQKYVCVVDLGVDTVYFYPIVNGAIDTAKVKQSKIEPAGSGPRHLLFQGNQCYLLNELGNTVMAFDYADGALTFRQSLNTLREGFAEYSKASAIRLSPDKRFLLVSNRGEETIAVFRILADGKLAYSYSIDAGGKSPRDFNFLPGGKLFAVANETTNNLVIFAYDPASGQLTKTKQEFALPNPLCVFSELPAK